MLSVATSMLLGQMAAADGEGPVVLSTQGTSPVEVDAGISVSEQYTDNAFLTANDRRDDFITVISACRFGVKISDLTLMRAPNSAGSLKTRAKISMITFLVPRRATVSMTVFLPLVGRTIRGTTKAGIRLTT